MPDSLNVMAYGIAPQLPAHLVGVVPVSLEKRIAARLLDSLVLLVPYAVGIFLLWLTGGRIIERSALGPDLSLEAYGVMALVNILVLVVLCLTGWLPGSYLLRVRTIRYDVAGVPGWRQVGKSLLSSLASLPFSIPWIIIVFATRDHEGRHAIDRWTSLYVIDAGKGADPLAR